ncbi:MAG: plasmid recombination protein [Oscillospiraceae bacterium]|nr:plasmid recombination protein [Oscillospiraceae bacterium]
MGFTIGMPCLKLSNVAKDTKHSGVFRKVVAEALKERYGKDKDIDKNKTSENIYFGFKTAEELIEYSEKFIIEVNTEVEEYNQTAPVGAKKRKVREDAVVMCATIIKPPAEMMQQLSEEEQEKLLNDALEKFKEIVGEKNVKSAVIHKDELVMHMHIFWQPVTKDGRLCAKEMHNKEFLRRLNKEMPEHLRSKGWYMVDDCKAYEEGSQEKKKAKRKSGKTSKVYKHEMDSLAEELALQREEIQKKEKEIDEQINLWIAHDRKATERCKKAESLVAKIDKVRIEVEELKQASVQEADEIVSQAHAEVAKLEEQKTVLMTEVETLYKELEIIRQENQLLHRERDRMIPEIEKLEKEIEESQQILSQLNVTKEEVTELQSQKKNLSEEVGTLQSESAAVKTKLETLQKEAEQLRSRVQESARFAEQNKILEQNLTRGQEELRAVQLKQKLVESTVDTLQQVARKIREENFALQREQHELLPELEKLRTLATLADDFAEIVRLVKYPLPPTPEKPKKKFGESDANYEKREAMYQVAMKQYQAELDKVPGVQKVNSFLKRLQQISWNLDDARRQAERKIETDHIDGKLLILMRELNTISLPDGSESIWSYYRKQKEYAKNDRNLMETLSAESLRRRQEQQRFAEEREMLLREQEQQSQKIQDADRQETEQEDFER